MVETLLRLGDVLTRTGCKKSKIYDLMQRGEFPRPVKIDACSLWPASKIDDWIAQRIAASEASAGQ